MTRQYSSVSIETTLSGTINSSVTSLVVAASTATTLMGGVTLAGGNVDQFAIAVDPETASEEIMWVTAVAGDTLTIVRARAGSSGLTHLSGATIRHVFTGNDAQYFQDTLLAPAFSSAGVTFAGSTSGTTTVAATAIASGTLTLPAATDTLVGKATTDTLTNKTLTTPVITNPKITLTYSAKTAAYTAVTGDEGGVFSMNNASSIQFNIPTDATFNFAIGTQFNVFWLTGAGQPTIGAVTPGTTTVISTGATSATPKLRVANSMATCLKIAANSWIVVGDIS